MSHKGSRTHEEAERGSLSKTCMYGRWGGSEVGGFGRAALQHTTVTTTPENIEHQQQALAPVHAARPLRCLRKKERKRKEHACIAWGVMQTHEAEPPRPTGSPHLYCAVGSACRSTNCPVASCDSTTHARSLLAADAPSVALCTPTKTQRQQGWQQAGCSVTVAKDGPRPTMSPVRFGPCGEVVSVSCRTDHFPSSPNCSLASLCWATPISVLGTALSTHWAGPRHRHLLLARKLNFYLLASSS